MEELHTERLWLRAWTTSAADLARLTDLYGRDEVTRWIGGPPSVPPDELPSRWAAIHEQDGRFGCWAIEPLDDGPVAGTVLFKPLPNGVGEVEVGWHLHPDSWGHGYATEAGRALVAQTFADGASRVHAVVKPGNVRSMAVCGRLGMEHRGRTSRYYGIEVEHFTLDPPETG